MLFDHALRHGANDCYGSPFDRALIVNREETGDGRSLLVVFPQNSRVSCSHPGLCLNNE